MTIIIMIHYSVVLSIIQHSLQLYALLQIIDRPIISKSCCLVRDFVYGFRFEAIMNQTTLLLQIEHYCFKSKPIQYTFWRLLDHSISNPSKLGFRCSAYPSSDHLPQPHHIKLVWAPNIPLNAFRAHLSTPYAPLLQYTYDRIFEAKVKYA